MRIGRQPDQRRPALVVSLRRLDHRDLRAVGGMHHLADVRQPLRTRRVELPLDEVAHVRSRRGLALRAVPEVETPAREGDVLVAVGVAVAACLCEHEGRVRDALDDDRRRRPASPPDVAAARMPRTRAPRSAPAPRAVAPPPRRRRGRPRRRRSSPLPRRPARARARRRASSDRSPRRARHASSCALLPPPCSGICSSLPLHSESSDLTPSDESRLPSRSPVP